MKNTIIETEKKSDILSISTLNFKTYPSIKYFAHVIEKIINTNDIISSIRIIPFYESFKLKDKIKYEKYEMYIECRHNISSEDYVLFMKQQNSNKIGVKEDDFLRYHLCNFNDHELFVSILIEYKKYIKSLRNIMWEELISEHNLNSKDLVYGNFCFKFDIR